MTTTNIAATITSLPNFAAANELTRGELSRRVGETVSAIAAVDGNNITVTDNMLKAFNMLLDGIRAFVEHIADAIPNEVDQAAMRHIADVYLTELPVIFQRHANKPAMGLFMDMINTAMSIYISWETSTYNVYGVHLIDTNMGKFDNGADFLHSIVSTNQTKH